MIIHFMGSGKCSGILRYYLPIFSAHYKHLTLRYTANLSIPFEDNKGNSIESTFIFKLSSPIFMITYPLPYIMHPTAHDFYN